MPFRTLDPDQIIATVETLDRRINERFPGCGLSKVCAELLDVARTSREKAAAAQRPNVSLRLGIGAVLAAGLALLIYVGMIIEVKHGDENLFGVLEGIDAAVNTLVVMGAGIFFLATLEGRWHRQKALDDLHELRSIVHVIDMHQLTKDPNRPSTVGTGIPGAPKREMTPFELIRYLDYCSEMLSLAAKVAALYAQGTRDPVVIETASDLGQTTSYLSSKIWQKITLAQGQVEKERTLVRDAAEQPALPSPSAKQGAESAISKSMA